MSTVTLSRRLSIMNRDAFIRAFVVAFVISFVAFFCVSLATRI